MRPGREVPARHERPAIDEAALEAARAADLLVAAVRAAGDDRWLAFLGPLPDHLRDDALGDLRKAALRVRAAYGPKASVREGYPDDLTEPLREAVDRLLRLLARADAEAG